MYQSKLLTGCVGERSSLNTPFWSSAWPLLACDGHQSAQRSGREGGGLLHFSKWKLPTLTCGRRRGCRRWKSPRNRCCGPGLSPRPPPARSPPPPASSRSPTASWRWRTTTRRSPRHCRPGWTRAGRSAASWKRPLWSFAWKRTFCACTGSPWLRSEPEPGDMKRETSKVKWEARVKLLAMINPLALRLTMELSPTSSFKTLKQGDAALKFTSYLLYFFVHVCLRASFNTLRFKWSNKRQH